MGKYIAAAKFFMLLFFCYNLCGQILTGKQIVCVNNTKKAVDIIKLDGLEYIDLLGLLRVINPSIQAHNSNDGSSFSFYARGFSLRADLMNFYVLLENKDTNYVFQLNTLPQGKNGKIYVPMRSFMLCLESVCRLKIDMISSGIYINGNIEFTSLFGLELVKEASKEAEIVVEKKMEIKPSVIAKYERKIEKDATAVKNAWEEDFKRSWLELLYEREKEPCAAPKKERISTQPNKALPPFRMYSVPDIFREKE